MPVIGGSGATRIRMIGRAVLRNDITPRLSRGLKATMKSTRRFCGIKAVGAVPGGTRGSGGDRPRPAGRGYGQPDGVPGPPGLGKKCPILGNRCAALDSERDYHAEP